MGQHGDLILLILPITLVDACGCDKSITCGHGGIGIRASGLEKSSVNPYYSTNLSKG
jgi:hypothetical protein